MPHLISPRDVQAELDSGHTVRFLDVRWRLDAPEGRPAYVTAHLPGAVYVDLERELAKRGYPEEGRYPRRWAGENLPAWRYADRSGAHP